MDQTEQRINELERRIAVLEQLARQHEAQSRPNSFEITGNRDVYITVIEHHDTKHFCSEFPHTYSHIQHGFYGVNRQNNRALKPRTKGTI